MNKPMLTVILALAGGGLLWPELETTVDLTTLVTATRDAGGAAVFSFTGKGSITFSAAANPAVKAECELEGVWANGLITQPEDILKRLFIKADLGGVQLLAGKARLSWGEGFVFNAGDVLFGSLEPVADLSEALLRDETDWFVGLTLPIGPLTYLEAVLLPYSPLRPVAFPFTYASDLRGGGRFVTNLAGLKVEAGYLFRADEAAHHPYLSLQGNLYFDLQLSASLKIPALDPSEASLREGLALSAGLFRLWSLEDGAAVMVRLEAALRPFGRWEETSAPVQAPALLLYPEISWAPLNILVLQARGMLNAIDLSGLLSLGATFEPFQGLKILCFLWCMWGDADDAYFGFDRQGDLGFSLGLNFIY